MIFEWFNTKEVDALALRLAAELAKRIPPDSVNAGGKKARTQEGKSRDAVLRQVRQFASNHTLNVFKKARLANRLKWALVEAGYSKDFVDVLAFELAREMATTRNPSK